MAVPKIIALFVRGLSDLTGARGLAEIGDDRAQFAAVRFPWRVGPGFSHRSQLHREEPLKGSPDVVEQFHVHFPVEDLSGVFDEAERVSGTVRLHE